MARCRSDLGEQHSHRGKRAEVGNSPARWVAQGICRLGRLRWIALQGVQGVVFRVATTSAHGQLDSNCPF